LAGSRGKTGIALELLSFVGRLLGWFQGFEWR
jgi:hypothetical protein